MNKLLPAAIKLLLLAILALAIPVAHAYAAPNILYDKTSVSVAQNATFTLTLGINVEANTAQSSKATVQYAPADLEVIQVADGHFFPSFAQANDPSAGLLEITGYTTSAGGSTANGQLATVTFKAKKGSGSSTVSFGCTGSGHDTNILTVSGQNLLSSCSTQTNQTAVSYTGSGSPTNTPTPTPGGPTPTPTPAQYNNTLPVCANLAASVTTGTGTPLSVTFTCSGVDTNGYINGAYFDFGDGTTDTITKNVGSPGAIATTHTYTTIGSLGVSCKVQDNDKVWSSVSDVCKKIVYIKAKPKVVVVSAGSTGTPTPTPTPTIPVVSLVEIIPTATPSPLLTPYPTYELPQEQSSAPFNWLLGSIAIIVVGAVIYLLSRRKGPPPPQPKADQPMAGTPPLTPPPPIAH